MGHLNINLLPKICYNCITVMVIITHITVYNIECIMSQLGVRGFDKNYYCES